MSQRELLMKLRQQRNDVELLCGKMRGFGNENEKH